MKLCLITILFSHYLPMLNNIKLLDCFKEFGPCMIYAFFNQKIDNVVNEGFS